MLATINADEEELYGMCVIGMYVFLICRQGGIACMPAAKLALEDVNGDKNLLPGFKLILHSNDSEVSNVWESLLLLREWEGFGSANITNLLLLTLTVVVSSDEEVMQGNRSNRVRQTNKERNQDAKGLDR